MENKKLYMLHVDLGDSNFNDFPYSSCQCLKLLEELPSSHLGKQEFS